MTSPHAIHLHNLTRSQNILIAVMRKLGVEKEGEVLGIVDRLIDAEDTLDNLEAEARLGQER